MVKHCTMGKNTTIFESNHGHKETNTCSNGVLKRCGHHLEDYATQTADADKYKQYTLYQYRCECKLPRIAQRDAYSLDEKHIKSKSWCKSERAFGHKSHEQCADNGRKGSGCEHRFNGKSHCPKRCKHCWQQSQNVNHSKKGSYTRDNFCSEIVSL